LRTRLPLFAIGMPAMCKLYKVQTGVEEGRRLLKVTNSET